MRKLLILFLLQTLFIASVFSVEIKSDISFYAGLESIHDNREAGGIPFKSALSTEINSRIFNLDFEDFSFGPVGSAKMTGPTSAYGNVRILGSSGFAVGICGSYKLSDDFSLSLEAVTGFGLYGKNISYASLDGAIRADYMLENIRLSAKTGVSYKRETVSLLCQIGFGIDFPSWEI